MYTDTNFPFDEDSFEDFDENQHAYEDPEVDSDEYWDDSETSLEEDLEDFEAQCSAINRQKKFRETIENIPLPEGMSLSPVSNERVLWNQCVHDRKSGDKDSIFNKVVNEKLLDFIFEIEHTPKYTFYFTASDIFKLAQDSKRITIRTPTPMSTYNTKNSIVEALTKLGVGGKLFPECGSHVVLVYINDDFCDKKYLLCSIEKVIETLKSPDYNKTTLELFYNLGDKNIHISDSGELYYKNDAVVHYIIMKNTDSQILGNDIKVSLLSFYNTKNYIE